MNIYKPLHLTNTWPIATLSEMLKDLSPIKKNEEYVCYDFQPLLTNIPLKDKLDYIIYKTFKTNLKESYVREITI